VHEIIEVAAHLDVLVARIARGALDNPAMAIAGGTHQRDLSEARLGDAPEIAIRLAFERATGKAEEAVAGGVGIVRLGPAMQPVGRIIERVHFTDQMGGIVIETERHALTGVDRAAQEDVAADVGVRSRRDPVIIIVVPSASAAGVRYMSYSPAARSITSRPIHSPGWEPKILVEIVPQMAPGGGGCARFCARST
jgi:hypothetical protein